MWCERDHEHALRLETELGPAQLGEAAEHEPRAQREDHRERELSHHETTAEACRPAGADAAAPAGGERVANIAAPGLRDGREAEDDARDERDEQPEYQNARVHADLL